MDVLLKPSLPLSQPLNRPTVAAPSKAISDCFERFQGESVEDVQRSVGRMGRTQGLLAWAERVAGTALVVGSVVAGHLVFPASAGLVVAGALLHCHARRTSRSAAQWRRCELDMQKVSSLNHSGQPVSRADFLQQAARLRGDEQVRAAQIVQSHGQTSLARMTLFDNKSLVFTPGGSMISYGVAGERAVALGDPIGPSQDRSEAIAAFVKHCGERRWKPAFYQVGGAHLDDFAKAGFSALPLGQEALVDVQKFSLAGGQGSRLRSSINKLKKAGYQAQVHKGPLPKELVQQLREVSDSWLGSKHGAEKGFSMGTFDDQYVAEGPVAVVTDPQGKVVAFANAPSLYQGNGIGVDLMRRRPEAAGGTMELLFSSLFEWAKTEGYQTCSLGCVPFSEVGTSPDAPLAEKAIHFLYEHGSQIYNSKGLRAFKEKWHPRWETRYLVHQGTAGLPATALALLELNSGKGFIKDSVGKLFKSKSQKETE
jgi:lysylphosphatidylglycerol synthetase-like protein (DUF2156 family)